jgi:hypothetical protein
MRLAIIGAGPYCTYAVERLAATAAVAGQLPLELHIFDRSGQFGAGEIHSPLQAPTSLLNRVARELSFAADETVQEAGPLLPRSLRPSLYEWCQRKFAATGDAQFDIAPESWPNRYLHGLALREVFDSYIAILREHGVSVRLHADEVTDLIDAGGPLRVVTASNPDGDLAVDDVLLLTGHSYNDPVSSPERRRWAEFARGTDVVFRPTAYPLETRLNEEAASPDRVVGCAGTMLTAIDVILHLTEGRGGRFEPAPDGTLVYVPSGREPRSIVAFSSSGLFPFARARNPKKGSGGSKPSGVFLTTGAVDSLRERFGSQPVKVGAVMRRQIDYRRHLFPLMLAEMAYVYYTTLLGNDFGRHLAEVSSPARGRFLTALAGTAAAAESVTALMAPIESAVDCAAEAIDAFLLGRESYETLSSLDRGWSFDDALRRYLGVVFGPDGSAAVEAVLDRPDGVAALTRRLESPTRHQKLLADNRFSWERTISPIPRNDCGSPARYRRAVIEHMERDHLWALQGIHENPAKTAADIVWRGLRPVVVYAVAIGGFHADSHRDFLSTWLRHHNRLAYGAGPEVMEKVLALVKHGVVDVSSGPDASVVIDGDAFAVRGAQTGARSRVDTLVDARVYQFDAEADARRLYPNLLRRGLVRKWRNPNMAGGADFEPGGLDLTDDFHPIRRDGGVDHRLTFLGPSIEGQRFFQGGAMKPNANHHAMRNIVHWLRDFLTRADLNRVLADAPR